MTVTITKMVTMTVTKTKTKTKRDEDITELSELQSVARCSSVRHQHI